MATQVIMPQMGFDMKEGTIVRWIKKEGELVRKGEPLAEIETDKAVVEVESYATGVLRKIAVSEGVTVPVGQVIGIIGTADEPLPLVPAAPVAQPRAAAPLAAPKAAVPAPSSAVGLATAPVAVASPVARGSEAERLRASPLARREAEERGIDLAIVPGTGPGGRITRDDVLRFAAAPSPKVVPAPGAPPAPVAPISAPGVEVPRGPMAGELVAPSRMRQAIAKAMSRSKQEIPHFYVTVAIDMTEAVKLRAQINEALGKDARVSINDMVVKACAMALPKHRMFNASYTERGIQVQGEVNIGVAVALPDGLIAPAIIGADGKSLVEIARASHQVVEHARTGHLSAAEYTRATFNVTNLGMYGVEDFCAIITPPQAAALAVGAVQKTPVVKDNAVTVADVMKVTLSIDHRVADGAQAAVFLQDVRAFLEKPMSLLL